MLVRDFECRSFEAAEKLLGNKQERRVCHHTTLRRWDSDTIKLELHGHSIVCFYTGSRIELSTCGWQTATTKDRLNRVLPSPWRVYQEGGQWFMRNSHTGAKRPFFNGMPVYSETAYQD